MSDYSTEQHHVLTSEHNITYRRALSIRCSASQNWSGEMVVMNSAVLLRLVCLCGLAISASTGATDHRRFRRGFRSFFYNYLDEIAMATCAAIPSDGPGLIYAVRRTCGEREDCKKICTDPKLRQQGPEEVRKLTWACTESLHVYKRQPALADNYDDYTDSHKLGLAVFRHHSCTVAGCGPNYCCCGAVAV